MNKNIILKLISFSKKFLLATKTLETIHPKKIMILDAVGSKKLIDALNLPIKDCYIFYDRMEKINIIILLYSIINFFKYRRHAYKINYIKKVSPKICITLIDTNLSYLFLKEKLPNICFIFIQNGGRTMEYIKEFKDKYKRKFYLDYYFVYGKLNVDLYKDYLDGKIIDIGSIDSNKFYKVNRLEKTKRIQYISQFRPREKIVKTTNYSYENHALKPVKLILESIEAVCEDKNLKLEILPSINTSDEEFFFYKSILKNDFDFKKRSLNDYFFLQNNFRKDALIIGAESSGSFQAFSRGFKTVFFHIRAHYLNNVSRSFGYPKINQKYGNIFCNYPNQDKMKKIIYNAVSYDDDQWKEIVNEYNYVMSYDNKNTIIKKIINNYIYE